MNQDENRNPGKFHINPQYIVLALIAVIIAVTAFKIIKWNRGQESDYDPTADTSEFDTETEDYRMYLDSRLTEGREDDGVTTILNIGNAPFARERGKDSVSSQLAELMDATVYNISFNNTYMSCKNTVFDDNYPNDAFGLYWLTKAITLQDYTLMDNNIDAFSEEDPGAADTLETLKGIDMDKVDIITIMYDAQDYLDTRITTSPYDLMDIGTCSGSLNQSLAMLKETYPYISIYVLSPTFACFIDENGEEQLGSTYRNQVGLLSDYMTAYKSIAVDNAVSFIDNYYGTVTESNYKEYLEDNVNLNAKGRKLLAERIAAFIK